MNKFSTNFFNPSLSQGGTTTIGGVTLTPVRVQDVIMNDDHAEYKKFKESQAIGVIKYTDVNYPNVVADTTLLPEAYMLSSNIKHFPLKNEIVLLVDAPSYGINSNKEAKSSETVQYYTTIVNVWNSNNHSATAPNPRTPLDFGDTEFKAGGVNPLQPYPGDILVEGRQGQSIRFTGTQHPKNTLTDSKNEGMPVTIIRNGQAPQKQESKFITENINTDPSSLWLTSNHTIPLTPAREKTQSYKVVATRPNAYRGNQAILNADRVVVNAKESDILAFAKESFGVSSKTLNLDAEEYATIDAKKVYLGELAMRTENQPVILGDSLEVFLNTLLAELQQIASVMQKAKTVDLKPLPTINLRGTLSKIVFDNLKSQIKPGGPSILKSKKVFTE